MPYKQLTDGYHTFRIPATVVTKAGTVLAFAEGRRGSASDSGHIDLVLKRSSDGGQTWGALQVVATEPRRGTAGNPAPVVLDDGRIVLVFVRQGRRRPRTRSGAARWRRPTGEGCSYRSVRTTGSPGRRLARSPTA
ncbi:hypothetical protein ACFQYP_55100 [Nonomuraea antimicrobica]